MQRRSSLITFLGALLLVAGSCDRNATAPTFGPRTLVSRSVVGDTLPALHYCTAVAPNTEQWVALARMTLVINRYDNFELVANDAHGSASFTTNAAGTKIYTSQSAQGGDRSVSGFLLPEQGGARELSMIAASSIYGNVADFAGRVVGDSAIITDRVHCDRAVGGDSVHVFTVILK